MRKPYWLVFVCAWCSGGQTAEPVPDISKLHWPTDLRARLASGFGEREGKFHGGVDLGVRTIAYGKDGTHAPVPVYAAEYGKVVYRYTAATGKMYGGKGDALIIQHQSGFSTVYGHIDPTVKVGDPVGRGQQIGTIAKWPDNDHLHFGVHKGVVDLKHAVTVDRALKGIYETEVDAMKNGALNPLKYLPDPKELARNALADGKVIRDISSDLKRLFGDPSEKPNGADGKDGSPSESSEERIARRIDADPDRTVPRPEPTPPRVMPNRLQPGAEEKKVRFGPIEFVLPEGWSVAKRREDGFMLGKGGVADWRLLVGVGEQPKFPGSVIPYTPEGIGRWILRISWGVGRSTSSAAVSIGKQKIPAFRITSDAELALEGVLFAHGGKVYWVHYSNYSRGGADEAFQKVLDSIALVDAK